MKATELMIGDWVLLYGEPTKVTATLLNMMAIDEDSKDVQPIPLDKPMLKANGFNGEDKLFAYYHCEDEDHPFVVTKNKYGFYCIIANRLVYINFVHELQHALRLCGLNELADNFQLE